MKRHGVNFDKYEQYMLKQVLTQLVDKDSPFQMETLTEHACAVHEAEKWLRTLVFICPKRQIQMQYWQVAVMWKILMLYPADDDEINGIRLLLGHIDKYLLTIQTNLNYEIIPKIRQSVVNQLAVIGSNTD